jgi:hypothetical protein
VGQPRCQHFNNSSMPLRWVTRASDDRVLGPHRSWGLAGRIVSTVGAGLDEALRHQSRVAHYTVVIDLRCFDAWSAFTQAVVLRFVTASLARRVLHGPGPALRGQSLALRVLGAIHALDPPRTRRHDADPSHFCGGGRDRRRDRSIGRDGWGSAPGGVTLCQDASGWVGWWR